MQTSQLVQEKRIIEISDNRLEAKRRKVAALCIGNLAMHRSLEPDEMFTLTHVPTGLKIFSVCEPVSWDQLKRAAIDLAPLFENAPEFIQDGSNLEIKITPEYREFAEKVKEPVLYWWRKFYKLERFGHDDLAE